MALRAALKDSEFIEREAALGLVIITNARLGAEHKKFVADEIAKWSPIINAAGNTPTERRLNLGGGHSNAPKQATLRRAA